MYKWADFLISQVTYDSNHLISRTKRHRDSTDGVDDGNIVDRLTIASDIKNGLDYITIYNRLSSWKRGHKIKTFRIDGEYYLRIDDNKVKLDYLGDLPEIPSQELPSEPVEEEATPEQLARLAQLEKQLHELESTPEKVATIENEHDIIRILQNQNKKLDEIENKLRLLNSISNP